MPIKKSARGNLARGLPWVIGGVAVVAVLVLLLRRRGEADDGPPNTAYVHYGLNTGLTGGIWTSGPPAQPVVGSEQIISVQPIYEDLPPPLYPTPGNFDLSKPPPRDAPPVPKPPPETNMTVSEVGTSRHPYSAALWQSRLVEA